MKKNVIIGVCGSIAAYKACEIVREFKKTGWDVKVIITEEGKKFVTPLTLEVLSQNPVYTSLFGKESYDENHISLSEFADIILVAPATANIIGKIASGICDDLLSCTIFAFKGPVIFAPAMNENMWKNKIVQENVKKLKKMGYIFVGPEIGTLASGKKEKVVLATKFGWYMGKGANDYGSGRKHIIEACENSLRKLKTDWIDLYIIHVMDPNAPMEETLYALDTLVREGKVRYIGTSKHPATVILEGLFISEKYGWAKFISEQPPYNILDRSIENELIPMCVKHGIGLTPFFPIASGLLSGKYRLGQQVKEGRHARRKLDTDGIYTTKALQAVEKLIPLVERRGVTLAEFSLAWLMQQPAVVSPILGARKVEYIRSGVKACDIKLTEEELEEVIEK